MNNNTRAQGAGRVPRGQSRCLLVRYVLCPVDGATKVRHEKTRIPGTDCQVPGMYCRNVFATSIARARPYRQRTYVCSPTTCCYKYPVRRTFNMHRRLPCRVILYSDPQADDARRLYCCRANILGDRYTYVKGKRALPRV